MTVLTEGQHTGEFLLSEGSGTISREVGTLLDGEVLVDGAVVALNGAGKLIAATGASGEDVVGISLGAHAPDGADKPNVPYIARLAEVVTEKVTVDGSDSLVAWDALAALNIVGR